MKIRVSPSVAKGEAFAPPSKSMAHRALFCAALCRGESFVSPVALSEDMFATMDALSALGASFLREGDGVRVRGMGFPKNTGNVISCRESGSTLRFVLPLCLLTGEKMKLVGSSRLLERPLSVYEDLCRQRGFLFRREDGTLTVEGKLTPGAYRVRGDISSQFITGLLFALSLLPEESTLTVTGNLESASYLDMTLDAMRSFGKEVKREGNVFTVGGRSSYECRSYAVEGDWSNAAFLEGLNLLGGNVCLSGLREDSLQGDRVCRAYFARLSEEKPRLDLTDCPDLAPVLFALAAFMGGAVFTGTARLAIKESDRGKAMAEELAKCGVKTVLEENRITVEKGRLHSPAEPVWGHNDHRIVMAMTLLLSRLGGEICGAEAVSKSFPDFFDVIKKLGIEVMEV